MLVEFASAAESVRCAVEIQRAMAERNANVAEEKRIEFRIGINVGEIIIEGDDIYGNGVNVAARLEEIAPPAGVYLSGTVYEQIENILNLHFEDLGAQHVKNISKPIRGYAVEIFAQSSLVPPAEDPRQGGKDVLRNPVSKELLLGIGAHVGERQHGDRRHDGQLA